MNYIIDGHNLIARLPGLSLDMPDDEQRLIELLVRFTRQSRHRVEVYFDRAPVGMAGDQSFGRVRAHFVHHRRTADQAIRTRLGTLHRSSRSWVVVSSDGGVQSAAREAHAGVMSAEEFAHLLEAGLLHASPQAESGIPEPPGDEPLSEAEVREWEAIFKARGRQK